MASGAMRFLAAKNSACSPGPSVTGSAAGGLPMEAAGDIDQRVDTGEGLGRLLERSVCSVGIGQIDTAQAQRA